VCIAGLADFFGEKNLRLYMEKSEELKVVEMELWDQFLQYKYRLCAFDENELNWCI